MREETGKEREASLLSRFVPLASSLHVVLGFPWLRLSSFHSCICMRCVFTCLKLFCKKKKRKREKTARGKNSNDDLLFQLFHALLPSPLRAPPPPPPPPPLLGMTPRPLLPLLLLPPPASSLASLAVGVKTQGASTEDQNLNSA